MSRERELAEAFVELAETLIGEYAVEEFLQLLVDRCVAVVAAQAVGVMLADEAGRLRLASASTEDMRALELFEIQSGQGPCWDASAPASR